MRLAARIDAEEKLIAVYPNPAHDFVTIEFESESNGAVYVEMIDITGKVVYNYPKYSFEENIYLEIEISRLSNGVYFIQLVDVAGLRNIEKVIVSH